MNLTTRPFLRAACLMLASLFALTSAPAAAFPDKPVRIIVPFPPGGSADFVGRLVAEKLTAMWGKPVVVENRPGGSATIGLGAVAKSPPDGHTIGIATGSLAIQPSIRLTMPYDTLADFEFVTQVMETPFVLTVNSALPVNSFRDLVAHAKANPGKLNIGSFGVGSTPHILAEILAQQTGTKIVHVPFKGTADSLAAQLAGDVPLNFDVVMVPLPHIKSGKLRPLVVAASRRFRELPDTPTAVEAGVPELEMPTWFGFLAPRGVPPDVLRTLNTSIVQVLKTPEVAAAFDKQAMTVVTSTPEEFRAFVSRSMQRVAGAVRAANIPRSD
jgi:tripartite-type tricarboxylate transporter receptor subunit TctC